MVGVGSGIAPFLGFVEEMAVLNPRHTPLLYYGCSDPHVDLLYANRLEQWQQEGQAEVKLAFGDEFVQHLMLRDAARLYDLLVTQNAHVYMCGHLKMGAGVRAALKSILETRMSEEEALAFYNHLEQEGRIKSDCFE